MREQLKPSVMLIAELDCRHAGCAGTFGPWTDGWSVEAKDQFINDVLDAYESVIGAPGVFRFLQARIHAERRPRMIRSRNERRLSRGTALRQRIPPPADAADLEHPLTFRVLREPCQPEHRKDA